MQLSLFLYLQSEFYGNQILSYTKKLIEGTKLFAETNSLTAK